MSASALLDRLIKALQIQPGVGPRSAARIAYHLLDQRREDAVVLGQTLIEAMQHITLCQRCRNYCDEAICAICNNLQRQQSRQLCVVESPADVEAIEQSHNYQGLYFVLHGHLSPIDGIGVKELGLPLLDHILSLGQIDELILATNPTLEGDATAGLIAEMAQSYRIAKISKIASGVPLGGSLDNIDQKTLASSLSNRRLITPDATLLASAASVTPAASVAPAAPANTAVQVASASQAMPAASSARTTSSATSTVNASADTSITPNQA